MTLKEILSSWTNPTVESHYTWEQVDASKIDCAQTCLRKFLFRYVLGWVKDNHNHHLIVGHGVHLAMDVILQYAKSELTDAELLEKAFDTFLEHHRQFYSEAEDEALRNKSPDNIFKALKLYIEKHRVEEWDLEHNEIPSICPISEDRELTGRMDVVVRRHEDDMIMLIDHKTSSQDSLTFREKWSMSFQINTYLHMLACHFGPEKIWGALINGFILRYSKTGTGKGNDIIRPVVHWNEDTANRWLHEANHWFGQIELHLELLNEASSDADVLDCFPCNSHSCTDYNTICPYKGICDGCSNPLQVVERFPDAPPGFKREFWDPIQHETVRTSAPTAKTTAEDEAMKEFEQWASR